MPHGSMMRSPLLVLELLAVAQAGVLLWSPREMHVPSLKRFGDEEFGALVRSLGLPKVVAFRGDPHRISDGLQMLLEGSQTAYIPNVDFDLDDVIALDGDGESNLEMMKRKLDEHEGQVVLGVLMSGFNRVKRSETEEPKPEAESKEEPKEESKEEPKEEPKVEAKEKDDADDDAELLDPSKDDIETVAKDKEEQVEEPKSEEPKEESEAAPDDGLVKTDTHEGPVVYYLQGKVLMYSAKALALNIRGDVYSLGKASLVTVDSRQNFSRVSVNIPSPIGKITLKFQFIWENGYWYMREVQLMVVATTVYKLGTSKDIFSARDFSYHCSGNTVFSSEDGDVKLVVTNIQLQPNTTHSRFGDAYDCINFTTAPIWSGIFVSSILLVVLGFALTALDNIKTMDKFDNSKSKQLTISVTD